MPSPTLAQVRAVAREWFLENRDHLSLSLLNARLAALFTDEPDGRTWRVNVTVQLISNEYAAVATVTRSDGTSVVRVWSPSSDEKQQVLRDIADAQDQSYGCSLRERQAREGV